MINRAKKKIERGKVRFDKTIANLQKEYAIMTAASVSFNGTVSSNLNKDALIDIDTDEPELPDAEVLEDTSREI